MIKYKPTPKENILITSDSHYYHNKPWIVQERGFSNQEEHAEFIFNEYTSLGENDTLVHLGDFFLTCPEEKAFELLDNIKCKVVMTFGNHNAIISNLYQKSLPDGFKDKQITPLQLKDYPNMVMMGDVFVLDISKREKYWCSHYPYMVWDKMHMGQLCPHIFGHVHGNLDGCKPNDNTLGKMMDVGVDNSKLWGGRAFFTLDEIRILMEQKDGIERDHH